MNTSQLDVKVEKKFFFFFLKFQNYLFFVCNEKVCEYYVHCDCQVLALNDCCETALYVPSRTLKSVTHNHHWREGNLPTNSKCIVCKKACWTVECLAGMKCEWCGIAVRDCGVLFLFCLHGTYSIQLI